MVTVRPLPEPLGAEIFDADLSAEGGHALFGEVLDALVTHQVVVIPGQTLTARQFADFARRFGRPQPH